MAAQRALDSLLFQEAVKKNKKKEGVPPLLLPPLLFWPCDWHATPPGLRGRAAAC